MIVYMAYDIVLLRYGSVGRVAQGARVGVTKTLAVNFSVMEFLKFVQVHVKSVESHSYLIGITATQLRWHLSNMNVVSDK